MMIATGMSKKQDICYAKRHFARVSHLWYISLPSLLHNYYDVKFSTEGWVAVRSTHKNTFFFCYRNSDLDLHNAGEQALLQYS